MSCNIRPVKSHRSKAGWMGSWFKLHCKGLTKAITCPNPTQSRRKEYSVSWTWRRRFTLQISLVCDFVCGLLVRDKCLCHKENKEEVKVNCACCRLSRFFWKFVSVVGVLREDCRLAGSTNSGAMSLDASIYSLVILSEGLWPILTWNFTPSPAITWGSSLLASPLPPLHLPNRN